MSEISKREACVFVASLTCVNYAKPYFIIAFVPMMLIFLIRDFIRLRGKKVVQMVKFGVCVLCSLWVLVFQYKILYPREGDSGVVVTTEKIIEFFSSFDSVYRAILGLAFPILILVIAMKKHYVPSLLSKSWIMYIITRLEYIFLQRLAAGLRMVILDGEKR